MAKRRLVFMAVALAPFLSGVATAAPIYATTLVSQTNTTSFGSGLVTGAPDGGGRWLGSTSDPPALLGSFIVSFATALGNGAGADLEIRDVASSANETFNVEVSSDGTAFTLLGEFSAVSNLVDFGAFLGPVSFVRLTNTSTLVSADIDALWGNYEFTGSVPEPTTLGLLGLGLAGLGFARKRKAATA